MLNMKENMDIHLSSVVQIQLIQLMQLPQLLHHISEQTYMHGLTLLHSLEINGTPSTSGSNEVGGDCLLLDRFWGCFSPL